jgi:hypothetical protein
VKDLPQEATGFAAWEVDNAFERSSKKQRIHHLGENIEEALFVVGLETAREQTINHIQRAEASKETALPVTPESLTFSADEEQSVKLLRPAAREALDKVEHLLASLKPLKRPRKGKTGLIDWKDVLNSAESLGWNTHAVKATAERCSAMFGEPSKTRGAHNGPNVRMQASPAATSTRRMTRSRTGGQKDVMPKAAVDEAIKEFEI